MPRLEFVVTKVNCLLEVESRFVGGSQFAFDLSGRAAEVLARGAADGVSSLLAKLCWLQSRHGERARGQAVDQESQICGELRDRKSTRLNSSHRL